MDLLLEQELAVRIFQHKTTMLATTLANHYKQEQLCGKVTIPPFMLDKQAVDVANSQVQQILEQGKLDEEYNNAWEELKMIIPDNYSTLL